MLQIGQTVSCVYILRNSFGGQSVRDYNIRQRHANSQHFRLTLSAHRTSLVLEFLHFARMISILILIFILLWISVCNGLQ